jgi:hypothetical protein
LEVVLDCYSSPSLLRFEVQFSNFSVVVSSLDEEVNWDVSILQKVDHSNIGGVASSTVSGLSSFDSSLGVEENRLFDS